MKIAHQRPWRMFWKPRIQQQHQEAGSRYKHAAISPATSHTFVISRAQACSKISSTGCPSPCVPAHSPREAAHVRESKAWNTTISSTQAKCNIDPERFFPLQTALRGATCGRGEKLVKDWHEPYTHTQTPQPLKPFTSVRWSLIWTQPLLSRSHVSHPGLRRGREKSGKLGQNPSLRS